MAKALGTVQCCHSGVASGLHMQRVRRVSDMCPQEWATSPLSSPELRSREHAGDQTNGVPPLHLPPAVDAKEPDDKHIVARYLLCCVVVMGDGGVVWW
mgnify:CR=1 FL=1